MEQTYLLDPERATRPLRQRLHPAYVQAKLAITCATNDQRTDKYSLEDPEDYRDSDGKLDKLIAEALYPECD